MATKINNIIKLSLQSGVMTTSWLESLGLSRTEQVIVCEVWLAHTHEYWNIQIK